MVKGLNDEDGELGLAIAASQRRSKDLEDLELHERERHRLRPTSGHGTPKVACRSSAAALVQAVLSAGVFPLRGSWGESLGPMGAGWTTRPVKMPPMTQVGAVGGFVLSTNQSPVIRMPATDDRNAHAEGDTPVSNLHVIGMEAKSSSWIS